MIEKTLFLYEEVREEYRYEEALEYKGVKRERNDIFKLFTIIYKHRDKELKIETPAPPSFLLPGGEIIEMMKKLIEKVKNGEMVYPEEFDLKIDNYEQIENYAAPLYHLLEKQVNALPRERASLYKKAQQNLFRSVCVYWCKKIFGTLPSEYPEEVRHAEC